MPTLVVIALVLSAVFVVFVVLGYVLKWQWTGVSAKSDLTTGAEVRQTKTLWDWLQLLGIPAALVVLSFVLTDAQDHREGRTAADAGRENTLRTYLAQMSSLMLDYDLLRSEPGRTCAISRERLR